MAKVIRHKTVDMLRRKFRGARRVLSELGHEDGEPVDGQGDVGQSSERHWRREAVQIVLAKLRPQINETNCAILHLHYWKGLTVPEIAGRLGLSTAAIWCRLHRLLRKLRRALASDLGEDFGKKARQAPCRPNVSQVEGEVKKQGGR
jgi:RNA polymerase sigma factor (sigma-70 family)